MTRFNRTGGIIRIASLLALCLIFVTGSSAQRVLEEESVRIETKARKTSLRPKGSTVAAKPGVNGVLFVLTDPEAAQVVIKRGTEIVQRGRSDAGQFRAELAPGPYTVEVSADKYAPATLRTDVKLAGTEPLVAELVAQTGTIILGPVEADATILIDGQKPASLKVKKAENQVEIDNIPAGLHTLRISHPTIADWERAKVPVRGGATSYITPKLEIATGELNVITAPGTLVYIDGEFVGATTADGRLNRTNMKLGNHEVKLAKEGFEEHKETHLFEYRKPVRVERTLTPLPTSAEFSDEFDILNPRRWSIPAGWKAEGGLLHIANAPVPGFPTGYRYRNFHMGFHLKLENDGGAAWIVRAKDAKNYYLFYLSGPQGLIPNRFITYIVKDNRFDPTDIFNSVSLIDPLTVGGEYDIEVVVTNDVITHTMRSAATGKAENLGAFKDPDNTFPIGNIGFRTVGAERFAIDVLFVQPRP
ncbi:MAG: carboxypeptidase regulatory-like domain-containing protein [Acidobacteriota bacterium]